MPASSGVVAILVVGAAGSGKSTIARRLARELRGAYLDKDSICGPLVAVALSASGVDPDEREGSELYRERVMPAEYESLFGVAGDNLRNDVPVVIDAPFAAYLDDPDYLHRSISRAAWPPVRTVVLRVFASEEVTRARLIERGLARDMAKLDDWSTFWSRWGLVPIRWSGVRVVDLANDAPLHSTAIEGVLLDLIGNPSEWRKST